MTKSEYKNKIREIEKRAERDIRAVRFAYATENNPVKIGDMVTDHISTIKVDEISARIGYTEYPSCVYRGIQYTTKGQPFKSGEKRSVYQMNMKSFTMATVSDDFEWECLDCGETFEFPQRSGDEEYCPSCRSNNLRTTDMED